MTSRTEVEQPKEKQKKTPEKIAIGVSYTDLESDGVYFWTGEMFQSGRFIAFIDDEGELLCFQDNGVWKYPSQYKNTTISRIDTTRILDNKPCADDVYDLVEEYFDDNHLDI